ncbi:MAG: sulfatase-like hydrolase/transferase [Chitinivibrionales bacterium]|nr:sulfatase-like hydrolase/transferase [Chitinivibrionales bacterium]
MPAVTNGKPNIVFVVSDQHRFDWMGCTGTPFVQTPAMDRMAREGTRFTNCYCNAPLCGPSRMAMMSGRHPYTLGVYINEHSLSSDVPTMAHALGLAGYETVLCGRMHFNGPDQRHGYQKRLVGDITRCYAGGPHTDFGELARSNQGGMVLLETAGVRDTALLQYDEAVTQGCEQYLRERASSDESRPLFLTVGWYGPHNPYCCPRELFDAAMEGMQACGDEPLPLEEQAHPWARSCNAYLPYRSATREQIRRARAGYAGAVGVIDRRLARVIEAAESLPGETIVVYTSDHGEAAGDRGMFTKGTFYENSSHVPMLWMQLNRDAATQPVPTGQTIDANISLLDLPSTFADIADAPCLPRQDGESIKPLLDHPSTQNGDHWQQRPVLADFMLQFAGKTLMPPMRMVRRGPHKLNYFHTYERPQLFDLVSDPTESHDLATDPAHAELVAELRGIALDGWDPEVVQADALKRDEDMLYMARWGEKVGMGPLETWGKTS